MPKENTTLYIILGLLNHEDLSGYDIKKRIDTMISSFWEVGYGQIYPTLSKLEAQGLVLKRISETSNGPEKNLYSITEDGKEALIEWLKVPEQKEYTKYEILVKLFFGNLASSKDNQARIEAFKARQLQNLNMMEIFKTNLKKVLDTDDDHFFYYLTVLFGEHIYRAYLEWSEQALQLLESKYQNKNHAGEEEKDETTKG